MTAPAWRKPPPHDVPGEFVRATDEATRAEVEEAITHLRTAYKRGPQGKSWQDQHHKRLDDLLYDWEMAPA
jgi:hypothetical protein